MRYQKKQKNKQSNNDLYLSRRIDNLSFGSKSIEKKQDEKAFSGLGIKIKVKPKKTEKKKKAPTPSPINLLSYGEEDLCVYIKHEKGINKLTFVQQVDYGYQYQIDCVYIHDLHDLHGLHGLHGLYDHLDFILTTLLYENGSHLRVLEQTSFQTSLHPDDNCDDLHDYK